MNTKEVVCRTVGWDDYVLTSPKTGHCKGAAHVEIFDIIVGNYLQIEEDNSQNITIYLLMLRSVITNKFGYDNAKVVL